MKHKLNDSDLVQAISFVWSQWRKQQLPLAIFIVLCLNLAIAPVVYAASDGILERRSAWAIGILGFVTIALVIYLFVVVFQPERF
ncbi:K(+)-transporting ATPase subunit F [Nostoc sp. 106C]|uniref:K(+)-transporting ATPase subunit F n=1 Tax=Nostoc sp. 106C TaxID=1932667 RepID=UPI000A362F30|nr:K(+)-transporting ATPase subunit F [Nostoc sp. 106C]OUL22387.1 potassium-transporting ATPase subunit F [Nostoc sp. RF31YmG]OUL31959.1 potassium-transporting ATPase subunit F [Nostoc sp. 106C]